MRIDHALAAGVTAEHVQVLPIAGSDHHALVVDVRPRYPRHPPAAFIERPGR